MRALTVIASLLINPYTLYVLKSQLAMNLVRIVPSSTQFKDDKEAKKLWRHQNSNLRLSGLVKNLTKIVAEGF